MSIHLGCANIAVPKHHLNTSNVGTIHQQIGCKTVAHCVWADVFCYADQFCVLVDYALYATGSKSAIVTSVRGFVVAAIVYK